MSHFEQILAMEFPKVDFPCRNALGESFTRVEDMKIGIIFNEDRTNAPLQIFTILVTKNSVNRFNTVVNNESVREIQKIRTLGSQRWEIECTYFSYELQKTLNERLIISIEDNVIAVSVDGRSTSKMLYKTLLEWLEDPLIRHKNYFWSHLSEMVYRALIDYGVIGEDEI